MICCRVHSPVDVPSAIKQQCY